MRRSESIQHKFYRIFTLGVALTALATAALLSSACTRSVVQQGTQPFSITQDVSAIFSTYPSEAKASFFIVKLKRPPLLSTATKKNGTLVLDPNELNAIDTEQTEFLKKMQALSVDIKLIYRYRLIINGVAIAAPTELQEKIGELGEVSHIEVAGSFERPILPTENTPAAKILLSTIKDRNSVKFIGSEEAHARGIRGQGMKIGIIDTGIDFTHAMFGGLGTEAAYKAVDPSQPNSGFPNAKIVGGLDLVGTQFNPSSIDFLKSVPVADQNPIDEAGHGSHVAGTVAGHGDGTNTYDGVAPDAALYALKVFGAQGSTRDAVVIAAMEWAADPNVDGELSDKLDVVNLSLGSGYGSGHILYSEAIRNLSEGGTAVVCSGGNSGDSPYIVGSPGATEEAISVAASVDDMDQNWRSRAAKFTTIDKPEILVAAVEGEVAKPLADSGSVVGSLLYVGNASQDFSPEVSISLAGKIAFIDRGAVSFAEKVQRAEKAGSIGVVIGNNQPGEPIQMAADAKLKFNIPAIMITLDFANELKSALTKGDVTADLTVSKMFERPELIDTMAGFSSTGPRSVDAILKPEIAAPGSLIISAQMGGGAVGVQLSGTSMAAPHMAGVIALLKQTHPSLSSAQLKSLVMQTAKSMVDKDKKPYPIARQGAGRVQVLKALDAVLTTIPAAISLGEMTIESRKTMQRTVRLENISKSPLKLNIMLREATKGLSLATSKTVELTVGEEKTIDLRFSIDLSAVNNALKANASNEISGFVSFESTATGGVGEVARIPVLAIANKVSRLAATSLLIRSTSNADSQGAVVDLSINNPSSNSGDAFPFNFIGYGAKKHNPTLDPFRSRLCDLAESGYRIIQKNGVATLQIAAKLFEPITTWDLCEISVLIDSDGDNEVDQELAGIKQDHLEELKSNAFSSVLLDAKMAREIRKKYEADLLIPPVTTPPDQDPAERPTLSYVPAVISISPMQFFDHSTIAFVEVSVADLKLKPNGNLAIRIATSAQVGSVIEPDDFLNKDPKKWRALNVVSGGQGYADLPESISVAAGKTVTVSFTKGAGKEALWLAYPNGKPIVGGTVKDEQSEIVHPKYQP